MQGYNAQVAVTGDQMIVACSVGQKPTDTEQLPAMMAAAVDAAARVTRAAGTP